MSPIDLPVTVRPVSDLGLQEFEVRVSFDFKGRTLQARQLVPATVGVFRMGRRALESPSVQVLNHQIFNDIIQQLRAMIAHEISNALQPTFTLR